IFTMKFVVDLFSQLLTNLQFLQKEYQLIHGNLHFGNIRVKLEPIRMAYSTMRHSSNLTFKIFDFRYASMNIMRPSDQLLRIFNGNIAAKGYLNALPFKPVIDSSLDETYYQITDFLTVQTLAQVRHLGIQYYLSFDTITLIISLLLIPEIYYAIMENLALKMILWDALWHPRDHTKMYTRVTEAMLKGENNYSVIINLLKDVWIKCELTNRLVYLLSDERLHIV
ncbi:MAG TPA: hypothetical protein VKR58_05110, partial [Aquella sp.]|nr:hypothetical protein [Aquella sp.]